ncbi:MAG: hypothetical protein AB2L22_13615 [Syntrophales bacterium]
MRKYTEKKSGRVWIVDNFSKRPVKKRQPLPPLPTVEAVEKDIALIREAKALHDVLVLASVDIRQVATVIAYLKRDEQIWTNIHAGRERQIKRVSDSLQKTKMRHSSLEGERGTKRSKVLRRIVSLQVDRIAIEDDPLYRNWMSGTKRRPYLGRCILLLERLLGDTKKPFHCIAVLFGLMPGGACDRCRERQSCTHDKIFKECAEIDDSQKILRRMAATAGKETPMPIDFLGRVKREIIAESERRKKHAGLVCPDCEVVFDDGNSLRVHLIGQHGWKKEHATFHVGCEVRDIEN